MPSQGSSYAPSYKTPYTSKSNTQLKTFSNENSLDTNNFTVSSFTKSGYQNVNVKQFNTNPLTYKTPIYNSDQSNYSN